MKKMNTHIPLLITKEDRMNLKFLRTTLCVLLGLGLFNSCSTGTDPEDVIADVFSGPLEFTLQIQNITNDMAMDVNAVVFNNLDTKKDTITDEIADCVEALIYRNSDETLIDSIVIDYGKTTCNSNGGSFRGKMIVDPSDASLTNFEVRFSEFYSKGFDISGIMNFQIVDIAGEDFTMSFDDATFVYTDSNDEKSTFEISEMSSAYTYIKSEEQDVDYVDDIFEFTSSLSGTHPNGTTFSLISDDELTYAYSCKNIIGGNATFVLTDVGEGDVNFGGGDTFDDCNGNVSVNSQDVTLHFTL